MLELALAFAALLIGATGTFSPCGLSVIETIGPVGHTGGRRTTIAACLAFLPGAILGGLATFGAIAAVGELAHGAGGRVAYGVAAAIALGAAVLEARGTRIVPQIRRQLPEHWRRVMPMPLAGALYGVLLGMGFTTFVLSFGVWALAGISFAVGDPALGLVLGASFGIGRAIPIVVLAPLAGSRTGLRANELMCERPSVYLGLRRGDAAALAVAALALVVIPGSAGANEKIAESATDPSATVEALVFQQLSGGATFRNAGGAVALPGKDPAIGGPYVAVIKDGKVALLSSANLGPVAQIEAPGADALAVSADWLVYRAPLAQGGDGLFARQITTPSAPGSVIEVATVSGSGQISPPSMDQNTLVYAIARPGGSKIVRHTMGTDDYRALVRSGRLLLFSPSVKAGTFAYVRTDARSSQLLARKFKAHGAGRRLLGLKRRQGYVWTSALTEGFAYAAVLGPHGADAGAAIIKVARGKAKRFHQRGPRGGGNHKF